MMRASLVVALAVVACGDDHRARPDSGHGAELCSSRYDRDGPFRLHRLLAVWQPTCRPGWVEPDAHDVRVSLACSHANRATGGKRPAADLSLG